MDFYKLRKTILKTGPIGKALKIPYMAVKNFRLKRNAEQKLKKISADMEKCKNRIFYLDIPIHPNMGDLAQYCCINKWLVRHYPKYSVFEIDADTMLYGKSHFLPLLHRLTENDYVFFQSGYCTQDLGGTHDEVHRLVVDNAPNVPIIMLQQTILFLNSENAERTSKCYAKHKNLMVLARDEQSFEFAKSLFPYNHLSLLPDFVTSRIGTLPCKGKKERRGILVCCRNDSEKFYSNEALQELVDKLKKIDSVEVSDTTVQCDFSTLKSDISGYVNQMIDDFSKYRVIITDRYHGTIFSLIAGTPVIVIKSNDHKVVTGVDWFKGIYDDCVVHVPDINDVYAVCKKKYETYDYPQLTPYFEHMYFDKLPAMISEVMNRDIM